MAKFIYGLLGLLLIAVIGVLFCISFIVSSAIESIGTAAVGAPVKVESVDISLLSGEASISGLSIANVEGYVADKAITLGKIFVSLDVRSLLSNVIHVKSIRITKPEIFYERHLKEDNFKAIQRNVDTYLNKDKSTSNDRPTKQITEKAPEKPGKKIRIDSFIVEEAAMALVINTPIGNKTAKVKLPKITINDIGGKEGGEDISVIAEKATSSLLKYVNNSAASAFGALKSKVINKIENEIENRIENKIERIKNRALDKLKSFF